MILRRSVWKWVNSLESNGDGTPKLADIRRSLGLLLTLPARQKAFLLWIVLWRALKNGGDLFANFQWSPSPWKRSTMILFGANFGKKIWKIRGTFVVQLFWPSWKCKSSHQRERLHSYRETSLIKLAFAFLEMTRFSSEVNQQFTYGVVREGVIAEHFPQISAKFPQTFCRISAPFPDATKRIFHRISQTFRQKPLR